MKIQANVRSVEKDYYDYLSYMFRDHHIVFDRSISILSDLKIYGLFGDDLNINKTSIYSTGLVGFCGKIYPMIQVLSWTDDYSGFCSSKKYDKVHTFYSIDSFMNWVDENVKETYATKTYLKNKLREFFSKQQEFQGYYSSILEKYPIFTIKHNSFLTVSQKTRGEWNDKNREKFIVFNKNAEHYSAFNGFVCVVNDGLFPIEFDQVFNAEQAYQEIETFLGSKNSIEKIVEIDEEHRMAAKGLGKCSFKKC